MSVISIVRPDTVTVDQETVERARAFYNQNHPDAPLKRRTPNQCILDYLDAGRPDVIVPEKKAPSTSLIADPEARKVFKAWAKDAGYNVDRDAVEAWEKAGKPVPERLANADVAGVITVRKLDSKNRPNGAAFDVTVSADEARVLRGGKRGRISWAEMMTFAPEGHQVISMRTAKTSIVLDNGALPTADVSLRVRLAEAEAEIESLRAELAELRDSE